MQKQYALESIFDFWFRYGIMSSIIKEIGKAAAHERDKNQICTQSDRKNACRQFENCII
jgi:hypothetical protein